MNSQRFSLPQLSRWLDRVQPSETVVMFALALIVGLTTGAGVWLFKQLIEIANWLFFGVLGGALSPLGGWTVLLVPTIGGLVVGVLMYRFVGEERHHGVAGIMEAVALAGGRLRYKRIPIKTVAASISIGAGASVGPEDPSVQIGANLGSFFGQVLRQSDDRTRTLVAAGAAGAISAAFNAPIAGIFFALELIIGELGGGLFGSITLAAVISAVFTQAVSGAEPAFHVPVYIFNSPLELPLYLVLGVLAGSIAAIYIRAIYKAHDVFHDLKAPRWVKPAIAGVMVGVVGIFLPQIFGVGYSTIEQILNGQVTSLGLLIALLIAKLILTPVSIGGGFPGGVFAPSLFLGATLGAAFGSIVQLALPGYPIVPAAFALVGMAAVLAGAVHAPLTAIILLFEMTNDYHIILPLMFAVVVSLLVSQRLQHDSVYELGLARKGVRLQRGRDVEVLDTLTVNEVMQTETNTLLESEPLAVASEVFARTHHHGLPVVNASGELVGILTVQDIERVHSDIHELAQTLCQLHATGRTAQAISRLDEAHALSDMLLERHRGERHLAGDQHGRHVVERQPRQFRLAGGIIDGTLAGNQFKDVTATFKAVLTSKDLKVNAPSLTVSFVNGEVQGMVALIASDNEHYGNLVGYLRAQGITPPSTAR